MSTLCETLEHPQGDMLQVDAHNAPPPFLSGAILMDKFLSIWAALFCKMQARHKGIG